MKYVFSDKEFVTMLGICEAKNPYCYKINNNLDNLTIVKSINSLYSNKFIFEEGDKFVVEPSLKNVVNAMCNSKEVVKIEVFNGKYPPKIIYKITNAEIVVLEQYMSEIENKIKVETVDLDIFVQDLIYNELEDILTVLTINKTNGLVIDDNVSLEISEDDFAIQLISCDTNASISSTYSKGNGMVVLKEEFIEPVEKLRILSLEDLKIKIIDMIGRISCD